MLERHSKYRGHTYILRPRMWLPCFNVHLCLIISSCCISAKLEAMKPADVFPWWQGNTSYIAVSAISIVEIGMSTVSLKKYICTIHDNSWKPRNTYLSVNYAAIGSDNGFPRSTGSHHLNQRWLIFLLIANGMSILCQPQWVKKNPLII